MKVRENVWAFGEAEGRQGRGEAEGDRGGRKGEPGNREAQAKRDFLSRNRATWPVMRSRKQLTPGTGRDAHWVWGRKGGTRASG